MKPIEYVYYLNIAVCIYNTEKLKLYVIIADRQPQSQQTSRERQRARRQRLTLQERQEINANRRANRTVATTAEREQENARRRDSRRNLTSEQRQTINTNQRKRRQGMSQDRREAARDRRKANTEARRNTPCAQSIAMPRPDAAVNPEVTKRSSPITADSTPASPSTSTPAYTLGTDGNIHPYIYSRSNR
jgi:hypothetical protein